MNCLNAWREAACQQDINKHSTILISAAYNLFGLGLNLQSTTK